MAIKVGINGFGRIGRNVLRSAIQNFPDIEIVAINDLLEPDYLAYMLQYDSVHGRFKGEVSVDGNTLIVNGKKIRLTQERDPANLKWNEVGADVVLEATGLFLDKAAGEKHLAAGAKKVIFSAPSKDDTPMFVFGVTQHAFEATRFHRCFALRLHLGADFLERGFLVQLTGQVHHRHIRRGHAERHAGELFVQRRDHHAHGFGRARA